MNDFNDFIDFGVKPFFDLYIGKYKTNVLPCLWSPRSIILSEGLAFCALADYLDVNLVIESGIYNGRSTLIWAKYFLPETEVKAVDLTIRNEALCNLSGYDVNIITGNGITVLPDLVKKYPNKKIALFIDGPKTHEAIDLAEHCFTLSDNVKLAALHDTYKGTPQRRTLDKRASVFFTDDDTFVDEYKHLDVGEDQLDIDQNLKWVPYNLIPRGDLGGSYAKTLALLFRK